MSTFRGHLLPKMSTFSPKNVGLYLIIKKTVLKTFDFTKIFDCPRAKRVFGVEKRTLKVFKTGATLAKKIKKEAIMTVFHWGRGQSITLSFRWKFTPRDCEKTICI